MTGPRWNVTLSVTVPAPSGRAAIERALTIVHDRPYGDAFDASAYAVHEPVRGKVEGQTVMLARDDDDDDA